jgi:hypothetical protein
MPHTLTFYTEKFFSSPSVLKMSATTRYVYLYVVTSPIRSCSGVYTLPISQISFHTGIPFNKVKSSLKELEEKYNKIIYDFDSEVVFVFGVFKLMPKTEQQGSINGRLMLLTDLLTICNTDVLTNCNSDGQMNKKPKTPKQAPHKKPTTNNQVIKRVNFIFTTLNKPLKESQQDNLNLIKLLRKQITLGLSEDDILFQLDEFLNKSKDDDKETGEPYYLKFNDTTHVFNCLFKWLDKAKPRRSDGITSGVK